MSKEIEAILTCEDCGDVAEVIRVPTDNEGVYEHRLFFLNPCRWGYDIVKCPSVRRKHG